ncbi:KRI1-like family C-terminal-domain-containing protein [Mucor mucedo]|uniref:KRI1-like family C-terminal-domain-containing protein n=1 Tax=Mucor mucedo TaxID=29922 RepID=UPI00221F99B4|nr:KRI1-like family C-terminal-domain-containing protein [Mucor mucedo]KAI7888819.1 KRI1-like family C-terminal-domain-containing protein [Mucor mucedo]
MSGFDVQIRERQNPSEDYQRPELLKKATEEIEAEVAALAEQEHSSDESSSYDSDEDEDDDANLLTAAMDSQIFRTIAAIKAKDPRVYEDSTKFFDNVPVESTHDFPVKEPEEKKVTLKDYERQILLENGGYVDEYKEGATGRTHHQEQEDLRNAFKIEAASDEDDEEDDFLTKKDKTSEEKEAEENDYRKFLLSQMQNDEPSKKAFEEWSNYKGNPNVKPEDAFLMDYVLNRGWVDKKTGNPQTLADDVDKDEADLDDIDRFESKYNFRFEEEGSGTIKTYARNIEGSVRRKESKRVLRRQREKLHKAALKERQLEEMKEQKNKKMREIHAKLKEVSDITGIENIDVDADYDPAMYDAQMQGVFDDAYYDGAQDGENVKPVWDDEIETGLPDDDIMDADYLPGGAKYEGGNQAGGDIASKDVGQRADLKRKYNDLLEEYYSLNYEDVVGGDLYTRFKYTKTQPEDYGLTAEEILLADDAELNKYISIKALAP